ncbi:MAG TPA: hypothetical protein VN426_06125 [Syntrophomonadaceae bacterium]|nr:hypothetical protein [Syntrophomonadaceae bacterium]
MQLAKYCHVGYREWLSMTDLEQEAVWLSFEWLADELKALED